MALRFPLHMPSPFAPWFRGASLLLLLLFLVPSAARGLTVGEERRMGREAAEQFLARLGQTEDRAVEEYVQRIGGEIVAANQPQLFNYTFYVVDDPSINAFAIPGGYVFVHAGLLLAADSEEEVAGVLAHEIGHVSGRHISRQISKMSKINLASFATLLGAIFLANDPKTAAAIGSAALAGSTSMQLRYSREMEEEADRLAFGYLMKARYDPRGLTGFMRKIMENSISSDLLPSYLTTHPGPDQRLMYLEGLVSSAADSLPPPRDSTRFKRIKTRLYVRNKDFQSSMNHFGRELGANPKDVDARYGLAMAYQKDGKIGDALENYRMALEIAPADPDILRDMGICHLLSGDPWEAIPRLDSATRINPRDVVALYHLGLAHKETGNTQQAISSFERGIAQDPEFNTIYYHLGICYGSSGEECKAYYYLGEYHRRRGDLKQARRNYERALTRCPEDAPTVVLIDEAIKELHVRHP